MPISNTGLSTALAGAVEPTKFINIPRSDDIIYETRPNELYEKRIHGRPDRMESIKFTIIIVIISAIIFVTVIAIYDIIRNGINNYYASLALNDPASHNSPEQIEQTEIANSNALWSSMVFASLCLISAIVFIVILIYFYTH
jgi:hypothetical protein